MKYAYFKKNQGIALLLAITVTGLLLLVSLAISNIAFRELLLSSTGRESQVAFFAANSGIECALYWDQKHSDIFATSSESVVADPQVLSCGNNDGVEVTSEESGAYYRNSFHFDIQPSSCAEVIVDKIENVTSDPSVMSIHTKIQSRGYNTLCDGISSRKLERAIEVNYDAES